MKVGIMPATGLEDEIDLSNEMYADDASNASEAATALLADWKSGRISSTASEQCQDDEEDECRASEGASGTAVQQKDEDDITHGELMVNAFLVDAFHSEQ